MRIGEALRLIRSRAGLTQTAASKRPDAPDHRTISAWETGRKAPSVLLLVAYLQSLGLDLHQLQDALDEVEGRPLRVRLEEGLDVLRRIHERLDSIGERLGRLEHRGRR